MKKKKLDFRDAGFEVIVTLVFCLPYLTRDFLPFGHDTMFHCGRISMLAEAIGHGKILPALYPDANYGYGYASPLFYCDFFNIIPALLLNAGLPLAVCYKFLIVCMSFLSVLNMMHLAKSVLDKRSVSWLAAMAYLFSNYHITDVYVRGALGEVTAIAFLPLVLEQIYAVLYRHENSWIELGFSLACLLLAHNLTFLFGVVLIMIFFILKCRDTRTFLTLCKGVALAFLLTVFFSLPMLEQLHAQTLRVSTYSKYYDLSAQTLTWTQYFSNKTVYGLAGRNVEQPMLENIGWFLTFAPLSYLLVKKKDSFVRACMVTGYVFMLAPSELLPWEEMHFLGFIQFPWRLNTIAMLMLCLPAADGIVSLCRNRKILTGIVLLVLGIEGIWHISSNYERTYGIDNTMSWQNIRYQEGIQTYDPERFGYKYEELQGGEYLPAAAVDFYGRGEIVTDENGDEVDVNMERTYNTMSVTAGEDGKLVLPLTWYKGYVVSVTDEAGNTTEKKAGRSEEGLVEIHCRKGQTCIVQFESTPLRRVCLVISLLTLIYAFLVYFSRAMRSTKMENSCFK